MSLPELKIGDVTAMKSASVVLGNLTLTYKPEKRGTRMVFLFLGDETDGAPLNVDERLNQLGWKFDEAAS